MRGAALALVSMLLAAPSAAEPGDYTLGGGDVVDVRVWREDDLSGHHTIDEDGSLRHALAGELRAEGLDCDALAEALRARLERDYLREARVSVTLVSSARRQAWVIGAVPKPGQYPVDAETRLLDLLFAAGGPGSEGVAATFYRMGAPGPGEALAAPSDREPLEEHPVDLAALLGGDLSTNREIEPGDVLVVIAAHAAPDVAMAARIRVMGEVQSPGAFSIHEAPTALDAVLAAGGFTEYASSNRVRLVRGEGDARSVTRLRLGDLVEGVEGARDVPLQAGDLLVIPESFF